MEIQTSRFGVLDVDEQRVLHFPNGLLGFPSHNRFALIQTGSEKTFFWLQCAADPSVFFKDYDVPLREEAMEELALTDVAFAQVLVVCNKVDQWLTGNLLGPLLINAANRKGLQV